MKKDSEEEGRKGRTRKEEKNKEEREEQGRKGRTMKEDRKEQERKGRIRKEVMNEHKERIKKLC